jgi:hypothetical protein
MVTHHIYIQNIYSWQKTTHNLCHAYSVFLEDSSHWYFIWNLYWTTDANHVPCNQTMFCAFSGTVQSTTLITKPEHCSCESILHHMTQQTRSHLFNFLWDLGMEPQFSKGPGKSQICVILFTLNPVWWPKLKNSPTVTHACCKRRLKWVPSAWGYSWVTLSPGVINTETWSSRLGVGCWTNNPAL